MSSAWQATRGSDALAIAVGLALALHAAVIGLVHFDLLDGPSDSVPSSLDVILVDWETTEAPDEADFLAQAQQRGAGDSPEVERPAEPLPFTPEEAEQPVERDPVESAPVEEIEPLPEMARLDEPQEMIEPVEPIEPDRTPEVDATQLVEQSRAAARASPDRTDRRRDFAERPRRKFVSANTREHLYAGYMRSWVAKVERVGNLNYPEQARRQNLAGNLVLSVDVLEDGSVASIRLLQSSGHDTLDEAAIRIVRLASPFSPLPEEITEEVDILTITRTWQFSSSGRLH